MNALIYIECKNGAPLGGSLELITAAHSLKARADAVLIGTEEDTSKAAQITSAAGADRVQILAVRNLSSDGDGSLTEDVITDILCQAASSDDYDLKIGRAHV